MNERLLDAIATTRRTIAEFEAVEAGLYAIALGVALRDVAPGSGSDLPVRAVAAEIAAATKTSDRTVEKRLDEAFELTTRFTATYAAFCEGRISRAHASTILHAGTRIDDADARAAYEELAVAVAERESVGRLRAVAQRLAERVLPRSIDERHGDAASERRVRVTDLDDGMAELRALLPATLAHGMFDRLTQLARAVGRTPEGGADAAARPDLTACAGPDLLPPRVGDMLAGLCADGGAETAGRDVNGQHGCAAVESAPDVRTIDQRRADLLANLVLTGDPTGPDGLDGLGAIRAEVLVTVPVLTLAGRPDVDGGRPAPAMLDGATPIDPATARRLAGTAACWDRVLTHPITGAVLAVDRYRPSAELRRFLRAVDERCRFPTCRHPARRCDIDHLEEASRGGPTAEHNLASECERHHVVRHAAGWRVAKSKDGVVLWTSPAGRVYPDHPPGVAFRPPADLAAADAPF